MYQDDGDDGDDGNVPVTNTERMYQDDDNQDEPGRIYDEAPISRKGKTESQEEGRMDQEPEEPERQG